MHPGQAVAGGKAVELGVGLAISRPFGRVFDDEDALGEGVCGEQHAKKQEEGPDDQGCHGEEVQVCFGAYSRVFGVCRQTCVVRGVPGAFRFRGYFG